MASIRAISNKSRGAAIVEMAIILPLLLLLTLGLIEYGWMVMKQSEISDITRYAARQAALPNATNGTVVANVATAMNSDHLGASGYTVSTNPGNVATVAAGLPVSVTITVPYTNIGLLNTPFIPVPTNLSASVTMAKEGPIGGGGE